MTPPAIRDLHAHDLPAAHGLSVAVRWPHRVEDWRFALALGQGLAIDAPAGLIGTAMAWRFGPAWGTFGMLIVAPDRQGQGHGARLMQAALATLGSRAVQLHATPDGEKLYRRLGFEPAATIRQHQGAPFAIGLHAPRAGERLRPAGPADLATLAALDSQATGMDRQALIAALLAGAEGIVLDRDGTAQGFAMLRRFGRGQVIGPVIAADPDAARLLVAHFLAQRQGEFLRIDATDASGLSPWLEEAGLPCVDTVTRMVRGTPPAPGAIQSHALVSQAFG